MNSIKATPVFSSAANIPMYSPIETTTSVPSPWMNPQQGPVQGVAQTSPTFAALTPPGAAPSMVPDTGACAAPLCVDGLVYMPVQICDLRPGDIGFEYKDHHRTVRESAIGLGEYLGDCGDASLLHSFLVVEPLPAEQRIIAADGSDGTGILLCAYEFAEDVPPDDSNVDKHASYLFLRMRDPELAAYMAQIGRNWTHESPESFSTPKAIMSPFLSATLSEQGLTWLGLASEQADTAQPLCEPQGGIHRMMCSEFIATIGAAAAIQLYKRDYGNTPDAAWRGLMQGRAGRIFACEPYGTPPSYLHYRMSTDAAVQPVGYLPPSCGRNTAS